jgi:hypothetical protein
MPSYVIDAEIGPWWLTYKNRNTLYDDGNDNKTSTGYGLTTGVLLPTMAPTFRLAINYTPTPRSIEGYLGPLLCGQSDLGLKLITPLSNTDIKDK